MEPPPPSRLPVRRTIAALLNVVVVAAVLSSGSAHTSRNVSSLPALPRLGAAQVVDATDVGDPYILTVGGQAYRFGTTDWRSNVPAATSTNLVDWHAAPDALPALPRWASPSVSMTWAPAVVAAGGRYVMYVTTKDAASGRQCIALALAGRPGGPYTDGSARPFLCQPGLGGSIDPSVVRDGAGNLHLLWKNDGNCCQVATALWEQDLSRDGLRLIGAPHLLLTSTRGWQQGNIEAPAMLAAAGGWWLFYSGGDWHTAAYATGIAWCPTVRGPCRDVLDHPFLSSTPTMRTPSGVETFRDSAGRDWVAFTTTVLVPSRRHPDRLYANRVLDVAPLLPTGR